MDARRHNAQPAKNLKAAAAVPSLTALREKLQSQLGRLTLLRHKCEVLKQQQRERRDEIAKLRSHCADLDGAAHKQERSSSFLESLKPNSPSPLSVAVWDILRATGYLSAHTPAPLLELHHADGPGLVPRGQGTEPEEQHAASVHYGSVPEGGQSVVPDSKEFRNGTEETSVPNAAQPALRTPLSAWQPVLASVTSVTAPTALEYLRAYIFHPAYIAFHPQGSVLNADRWWTASPDAVLCSSSWTPAQPSPAGCTLGTSCTALHAADSPCTQGLQALMDHVSTQLSTYSAIVASLASTGVSEDTEAQTEGRSAPAHGSHGMQQAAIELDWSQVTPYLTDAEQHRLIQAYVALDAANEAMDGVGAGITGSSSAREGATKLLSILVSTASLRRDVSHLTPAQQVQFVMYASRLGKGLLFSSDNDASVAGQLEAASAAARGTLSTSNETGMRASPRPGLPSAPSAATAPLNASVHSCMQWPLLASVVGDSLSNKRQAELAASVLLSIPIALALCTWPGTGHGAQSPRLRPALVQRQSASSTGRSPAALAEVGTLEPLAHALCTVPPSAVLAAYTRILGLKAPFPWLRACSQRVQRGTGKKWRREVGAAAAQASVGGSTKRRRVPIDEEAAQLGTTVRTAVAKGNTTHGFMVFASTNAPVDATSEADSSGSEDEDGADEAPALAEEDDLVPSTSQQSTAFCNLPAAVPLPGRRAAVVSAEKAARVLKAIGKGKDRHGALATGAEGSGAPGMAQPEHAETGELVNTSKASGNSASQRYHATASRSNDQSGAGVRSSHGVVAAQARALHRLLCALASTDVASSAAASSVSVPSGVSTVDMILPLAPESVTPVTLRAFRILADRLGAHAARAVNGALYGLQPIEDSAVAPDAAMVRALCDSAGQTGALLWAILRPMLWQAGPASTAALSVAHDKHGPAHPGVANAFIAWIRHRLVSPCADHADGWCGPDSAPAYGYHASCTSPGLYCLQVMQAATDHGRSTHAVRLHDFLLEASLRLLQRETAAEEEGEDQVVRKHWCAVRCILAAWHALEEAGQDTNLHASMVQVLRAVGLSGSGPLPTAPNGASPLSMLSKVHASYLAHIAVLYVQQGALPALEHTSPSLPGSVACRWTSRVSVRRVPKEHMPGNSSDGVRDAASHAAAEALRELSSAVAPSLHGGGWPEKVAAARVLSLCGPSVDVSAVFHATGHSSSSLSCCPPPPVQAWLMTTAMAMADKTQSAIAQAVELAGYIVAATPSATSDAVVLAVLQAVPAFLPFWMTSPPDSPMTSDDAWCRGAAAVVGILVSTRSQAELSHARAVLQQWASDPVHHSVGVSLDAESVLPSCDRAVEVWAAALLEGPRQHSAQPFASMLGAQEAAVEQNALALVAVPLLILRLQLLVVKGSSRTAVPLLTLKRCTAAVRAALNVATAATLLASDTDAAAGVPKPAFIPAVLAEALLLLQYAAYILSELDMCSGADSAVDLDTAAAPVHPTWEQRMVSALLQQAMSVHVTGSTRSSTSVHAVESAIDAAVATASALSSQLAPLTFLAPDMVLYEARVQAMLAGCLSSASLCDGSLTVTGTANSPGHTPSTSTRGAGTVPPAAAMDTVSLIHSSATRPLLQPKPAVVCLLSQEPGERRQGTTHSKGTEHGRGSQVLATLAPWRGACPVYLASAHAHLVRARRQDRSMGANSVQPLAAACAVRLTHIADNAYTSGALLPDSFHATMVKNAARSGDAVAAAVLKCLSAWETAGPRSAWPLIGPVVPQLSLPALPSSLIAALAACPTASAEERRAVTASLLLRCGTVDASSLLWSTALRVGLTQEALPVHAAAAAALWARAQPLSALAWRTFASVLILGLDCSVRLHGGGGGGGATGVAPGPMAASQGASKEAGLSSDEAQGVFATLASVAGVHGVAMRSPAQV